MKSENFRCELSKIKDENIKKSTEYILNLLPDYFYTMPASTSGKYHPEFSLGEKGLVRHVKVVSRIAEELFLDSVFSSFDEHKKDLIRMSILLYDGLKKGIEEKEHTDFSHPIIMANLILENKNDLKISIKTWMDLVREYFIRRWYNWDAPPCNSAGSILPPHNMVYH